MDFIENKNDMKKGIISIIIILLITGIIGAVAAVKNITQEDRIKYYIDFAQKYHISSVPDFNEGAFEGKEDVNSEDFLMFVYYIKNDELSEEGAMSKELVESVMRNYFGIKSVKHTSLFKTWDYDEEQGVYVPVPQGTEGRYIFDTINFNTYIEDGRTIYDVTLKDYLLPYIYDEGDNPSVEEYNEYLDYSLDDNNYYAYNVKHLLKQKGKELQNEEINIYSAIKQMILERKTDKNTIGRVIRIKYYINEETNEPVFIYKAQE